MGLYDFTKKNMIPDGWYHAQVKRIEFCVGNTNSDFKYFKTMFAVENDVTDSLVFDNFYFTVSRYNKKTDRHVIDDTSANAFFNKLNKLTVEINTTEPLTSLSEAAEFLRNVDNMPSITAALSNVRGYVLLATKTNKDGVENQTVANFTIENIGELAPIEEPF